MGPAQRTAPTCTGRQLKGVGGTSFDVLGYHFFKQYGIKRRSGAAELARDVTRAMHAQPMHCVLQVDIANAFGSIQREEVQRSIEQIGHPAGQLAIKWLWSEHSAAVALPTWSRIATYRKQGRSATGRSFVRPCFQLGIQRPRATRPRPSRSWQQGRA